MLHPATFAEAVPNHIGDALGTLGLSPLQFRQCYVIVLTRLLSLSRAALNHIRSCAISEAGFWKHMKNIKAFTEDTSINNPNKIAIKGLTREALSIGHARMLHLNYDTSRRLYVGTVDFSVRCGVTNFSTVFWEKVLPITMPSGFILPPRIAIPAARMSPMMHDARPTFGDHRRAARRTASTSCGGGLAALVINYGVLQPAVFPKLVA